MGTTPPVETGSVRPQARANVQKRELRGELVHLTGAEGRVKVQRAGSFEQEVVGAEGLTVNADDQVIVPKGGRVTATGKSGSRTISGASGQVLSPAGQRRTPKPPRPVRATGLVRPAGSQR